jgi:dihydroorotase
MIAAPGNKTRQKLMTNTIQITRPDDWHIHLRDGDALALTVGDAAKQFRRAIVMPNLVPPVTNAERAMAYRARILAHAGDTGFEPLMVLYLTDKTSPEIIAAAKAAGVVACKLYPAGATTNSDSGVTDIENIYPALETMADLGMLLLVHGEVTHADVDIFDREKAFIDNTLVSLRDRFPSLRLVLEHITTGDAVQFVDSCADNTAATITAHHLLFNRNHMLVGGIRPHYYCLPILKRSAHQEQLIKAATSGDTRFFLGTDSAPHAQSSKETGCGCAGCYTAYAAIELYAEAFEQAGALDKLEGFASFFGPDFYGLKRNQDKISLVKQPWQVPEQFELTANQPIVPLLAGETLQWQLAD